METIELKDLVGLHYLSGVDRTTTQEWTKETPYEDAAVLNFILDEKTYSVVENPEDGYRSCLGQIYVTEDKIENTFEPIALFAHMRTERYDNHEPENIILDFYDVFNGKRVMSIGTENWDDWYPYFVADFEPRNFHVNE